MAADPKKDLFPASILFGFCIKMHCLLMHINGADAIFPFVNGRYHPKRSLPSQLL